MKRRNKSGTGKSFEKSKRFKSSGQPFSASNPYGQKDKGDKRQFSRI
jgi:hypothetical protein